MKVVPQIQQETYDGEWPSDKLAKGGFTHDIKIPRNLASGDYVSDRLCELKRMRTDTPSVDSPRATRLARRFFPWRCSILPR